jgi:hypothetical protein
MSTISSSAMVSWGIRTSTLVWLSREETGILLLSIFTGALGSSSLLSSLFTICSSLIVVSI